MPFVQACWQYLKRLPLAKIFFTTHALPFELEHWQIFHYLLGSRKQEQTLNCMLKPMSCRCHLFLMSHWNTAQRNMMNLISTA